MQIMSLWEYLFAESSVSYHQKEIRDDEYRLDLKLNSIHALQFPSTSLTLQTWGLSLSLWSSFLIFQVDLLLLFPLEWRVIFKRKGWWWLPFPSPLLSCIWILSLIFDIEIEIEIANLQTRTAAWTWIQTKVHFEVITKFCTKKDIVKCNKVLEYKSGWLYSRLFIRSPWFLVCFHCVSASVF